MTILLYGSTGFLGRHFRARLLAEGHSVIDAGRDSKASARLGIDAIINCAGEITERHHMLSANLQLVEDMLWGCDEGVSKIIHVGSSSEYGDTALPRAEITACIPTDLYSATKIAATALCQGVAREYDVDIVVARPFSLYGSGDTPRKLIPRLLRAARDGSEVSVFDGSHDWLCVSDFCDGILALLAAPRSVTQGEVFNFGTGISTTNRDLYAAAIEAFGPIKATFPERAQAGYLHSANWVADITKARRVLNWEPKTSLSAGLRLISSS